MTGVGDGLPGLCAMDAASMLAGASEEADAGPAACGGRVGAALKPSDMGIGSDFGSEPVTAGGSGDAGTAVGIAAAGTAAAVQPARRITDAHREKMKNLRIVLKTRFTMSSPRLLFHMQPMLF